jgi:acetyltransferase-like isoleucine patch superfamily enzyme
VPGIARIKLAIQLDLTEEESMTTTSGIQTANISPAAKIGKNVRLAPDVVIHAGAELGDNVIVEHGVIIYENVKIGKSTYIGAQCILGERLIGYLRDPDNYTNPPLEIGENSTIRSGTIIYSDCKMGSGFQTGHRAVIRERSIFGKNCSFGTLSQSDGEINVGNDCRFHNNVFIATYTTCEDGVHFYPMSCTVDSMHPPCQKGRLGPYFEAGVTVGAKVLVLPRVRVGAGAVLAGASVVTHDVPANMVVAGAPAKILKRKDEVRCHIEDRPAYEVALESLKCTEPSK